MALAAAAFALVAGVEPVGQYVVLNNVLFQVIGLMAPRGASPQGQDQDSASSTAALSASYEVDLWGSQRLGVRAAGSGLRASRFDQESARLTVVTGVADAYLQVLSLRGRLVIARQNLAIAERVYAVAESRSRNGAASELDRVRQKSAVLSQRLAIPPLELQEIQTLHALASSALINVLSAPPGCGPRTSGPHGRHFRSPARHRPRSRPLDPRRPVRLSPGRRSPRGGPAQ